MDPFCKTSKNLVAFCVRRAIIKKQGYAFQKERNMNKNNFTELFKAIRDQTLGEDRNSSTDIDDAYDTFLDLTKQIKETDTAYEHMEQMAEMDKEERLHWRMCLAENGIEMTPSQVDEYIILLDLAIAYHTERE